MLLAENQQVTTELTVQNAMCHLTLQLKKIQD
jgi:hypothetical protein